MLIRVSVHTKTIVTPIKEKAITMTRPVGDLNCEPPFGGYPSEVTPMNIEEFKKQYGVRGFGLSSLVQEFIRRSPEFPGDRELAGMIGEVMADLESALVGDVPNVSLGAKTTLQWALNRMAVFQDMKDLGSETNDLDEARYNAIFALYNETIRPTLNTLGWDFTWYDPDTSYEEDTDAFVRAFREFCKEKGIEP